MMTNIIMKKEGGRRKREKRGANFFFMFWQDCQQGDIWTETSRKREPVDEYTWGRMCLARELPGQTFEEGACLRCSSSKKKEASLVREVSRRERWCWTILKNVVAFLLLLKPQVTRSPSSAYVPPAFDEIQYRGSHCGSVVNEPD